MWMFNGETKGNYDKKSSLNISPFFRAVSFTHRTRISKCSMHHLTEAFWVRLLCLDVYSQWMGSRKTEEGAERKQEWIQEVWVDTEEGEVLGENWIPGKLCVWSSAAHPAEENHRRAGFAGKGCSEEVGKPRITLSKQSFHPNVREVTWRAATAHNWAQWVCSNPRIRGSFLSASFAPYLHYLISEIMRSQAIKHFDTCWQTASHNGTALLSTWIHNFELSCFSLAPPWRCSTPSASVGYCVHREIFARMVLVP